MTTSATAVLLTLVAALSASPATAAQNAVLQAAAAGNAATQAPVRILAEDIENAVYHGGDLPPGQSALTAKVQILLDRSGISPGVVDGWRGGMSESAIKAFQRRAGLPMTGQMNPVVWELLQPFTHSPLTLEYTITEQDTYGLVDHIPSDYGEKAKMTSQGYTSTQERLAERFHMDERFLAKLNPGVHFTPGTTIKATAPAKAIRGRVARIIVDKTSRRVAAYDEKGRMLADYPATVGSDQTPSPQGTHLVNTVAINPTYTYNPGRNFKQGNNDRVLVIPAGPNGPVGDVWIDLSKPTYGIHGTATPSRLFVNQSNGCVRLTNWDAKELAGMVQSGKTIVEFLEPGVSIADVTVTPTSAATLSSVLASSRPRPRPLHITQATTATTGLPLLDHLPQSSTPEAIFSRQVIAPTAPPRRRQVVLPEQQALTPEPAVTQTILPPPPSTNILPETATLPAYMAGPQ